MAAVAGKGAAAWSERQRMILGKGALAVERRHDRGLQQLGKLAQLVGRFGIKDALPHQDYRTGGIEQHLRGVVDVALVAGRPAGADRPVLARVYVNLDAGDVGRHFHHDRAGAPVFELGEGPPHDVADLVRQLHLFDRFGNRGVAAARFEHREELRGLARVTERQKQHRRRIGKGGGDAGEGIFGARPVLHRKDARRPPVRHPGEAVGHMDADPFLAADHRLDADRGGGLDDRRRRKAKQSRDAFAFQDLGNHVHDLHWSFLPIGKARLGAVPKLRASSQRITPPALAPPMSLSGR